jgi:non-specific serine/threonine protein kinase
MPPPPSHISPARRNALPAQTNALIGRLDEVETVRKRLLDQNVRLLTLTGIGGSGKTRLSLAVAETLIASYSLADGVYYVDLAAVSDPAMMMPSIALALGVREPADRSLADCMRGAIGQSELLLVLDNLEQVVDAAPELAALLAACPRLTILTTSRTALRIRGEWVIQVNPLPLPDPVLLRGRGVAGVAELADAPAVRLFVERAREVRPDFAVTPENATVVAQICRRLDGLPLAIELAAARARMFSPRALLERLSRPLDLLTGGARDLPARQQTMRDAIAWSYGLLPPAERALFRRLAIFPGGCSLEAVRYVCDVDEEFDLDPIDGLRTLVDTSLIQPVEGVGGEPRFRMLDTVREYGQERLADDDTPALYVRRHATYCLAFAEEAEAGIEGQEQASWLARLETEQDNVRAVLNWALNNGEYTIALRLGGALWRSWRRHGSAHDGRAQLDAALSHGAMVEPEIRLKALIASAELACHEGKVGRAIELCKESLTLCEALGDLAAKAQSLHILGWCTAYDARSDDDYRLARTYQEECLALQRQRGHQPGEAKALHELGEIARYLHEYEDATSYLGLALAMRRSLGDAEGTGWSTHCLAWTAYDQGRYDHAMRQAGQASDIWRRTKNDHGTATTANLRARIAWKRTDVAQAAREVGVSLRLWSALQSHESLSYALIFVAGMALKLRPDRRGALRVARILATAELLRDDRPPPTHRRHEVDEIDAALATHLDEYARLVAREKGRAMSADTATHLAAEMARRWSRPAPRR